MSLAGIEAGDLAARLKRDAAMWIAIGVCGLIVLVFLLIAANAALSLAVGPVVAPLIIALVAALIGLAVSIIGNMLAAAARRRELERKRAAEASSLVSSTLLGALPIVLKSPLLRQIGIPAAAAIAAALLMRSVGGPGGDKEP